MLPSNDNNAADFYRIAVTPIGRRFRWTIAPVAGGKEAARGEAGSHADAWREAVAKKMRLELEARRKPPAASIKDGAPTRRPARGR